MAYHPYPNASTCGSPNYSDRCELSPAHGQRHRDGIMTWPQGVERPVDPPRSATARRA